MAVFSKLLGPLASAYGLQALCAAIFVPRADETYYDLCGALGFISTVLVSLYGPAAKLKFWNGVPGPLPSLMSFAPRQLILSAALGIWSLRLGTYLATRAIKAGGDSRFDEIKKQPKRFTYYWFAQATWVFAVGLPVYLSNSAPPVVHPALNIRDYLSLGLIVTSFLIEVVADTQKSQWRARKDKKLHDEKFISSGLWSLSRHPNYIGEVGIWTGIWALSSSAFQTAYFPRGTVALAAISPFLTYHLLRNLSGVPPLERAGNRKFGNDPKYQEYKKRVPVFWPWVKT